MKITVCAKCGSQDLERLAWVTHRTNQYVDDYYEVKEAHSTFYCNKCGDRCEVKELQYSEKHGSVYMITPGNDPVIMWWPMNRDGTVEIEEEGEIDLGHCMAEEGKGFYDEICALFPDKKPEIAYIFRSYIDPVEDFVIDKLEEAIQSVFQDAHKEFKTKSCDIELLQQTRLDQLQQDLVRLITQQVKQNL